MSYALKLASTSALVLLALSACNPAAPTNNAALAAEQNAAAAADANMDARMDDQHEADMMHDRMKRDDMDGMGNMPGSKMPATKNDPMANTQSMNTDKPMADDMDHM